MKQSFPRRSMALAPLTSLTAALVYVGLPISSHAEEHGNGITTIDVTHFGARGDGVADDAFAINKAVDEVRRHHVEMDGYSLGCRLLFPSGVYVVGHSINLTMLRNINTIIDGQGSVIIGRCEDAPVLDALGARWLTVNNLTVLSDREHLPSIGIQIGRVSVDVADSHRFSDVKVVGSFSKSCFYNRGSETSSFDHMLLWNRHIDGYCLIQDGLNHFDYKSEFVKNSLCSDKDGSFNENIFFSCDFRHQNGGLPVWLGDTTRHEFIRCYAATRGRYAFVIFCGPNSHAMLNVDCHCETVGLGGVFCFSGFSPTVVIKGFCYIDHGCFAESFVLTSDKNIKNIFIQNANIDVATYRSKHCRVFDLNVGWKVSGRYYSSENITWNGDRFFSGILLLGNDVNFRS